MTAIGKGSFSHQFLDPKMSSATRPLGSDSFGGISGEVQDLGRASEVRSSHEEFGRRLTLFRLINVGS